jgi:hypothetical protein
MYRIILFLVALALPVVSGAQPRDEYDELHREWARFLPPGSDCTWPTHYVDARAGRDGDGSANNPFASLDEALAAASDPSVCGPTIILVPGRYELGQLIVDKPTILRGQLGTTIVGSIVNVSALPVWLEDLTLADAPFPGAVFAVHPQAETTILHSIITGSNGSGVVVHGGRLEMSDSRIELSRLGDTPGMQREISGLVSSLPKVGQYVPSHLDRMQEAIDTLPDGAERPELSPNFVLNHHSYLLSWLKCFGTGLHVSGGGYANVNGSIFSSNARAGIVAEDIATFVEGQFVGVEFNGLTPPSTNDIVQLLQEGACLGGVQVRKDAFVLLKDVLAVGNQSFGVVAHHGGLTFFDGLIITNTQDQVGLGQADGMAGLFGGSLAAQNFFSASNGRVGITDIDSLSLFLFNGQSTGNRFGLLSDNCEIEDILPGQNVIVSGNQEKDILLSMPPCNLPIPDDPSPLP